MLKDESDLQFLLSSNLESNEEHRINYVAVSRARDKLFISTPSLLCLLLKEYKNCREQCV